MDGKRNEWEGKLVCGGSMRGQEEKFRYLIPRAQFSGMWVVWWEFLKSKKIMLLLIMISRQLEFYNMEVFSHLH